MHKQKPPSKRLVQADSKLLVIANPVAGKHSLTIAHVQLALERCQIQYDLTLVKDPEEASAAAKKHQEDTYGAVVVFGGDGTVIAILKALANTKIPAIVLPGGSANAIAKALGVPANIDTYLRAFAEDRYVIRHMPIADAGGKPLVLDIHFGLFSEAIHTTPRSLKRLLGGNAYGMSLVRKLSAAKKHRFTLEVDGKVVEYSGYACFIINTGNPYILGIRLWSAPKAGQLRVFIVRRKHGWQLLQWYVFRLFGRRNLRSVVATWQSETVKILTAPGSMHFDDDRIRAHLPLIVAQTTDTVRIVAPVATNTNLLPYVRWLRVSFYRFGDLLLRTFTGVPSERFSRISKYLYLGGQYDKRAITPFKKRNITGIISMREYTPAALPKSSDIALLHLPTIDRTPPTLGNLQKGITFIEKNIAAGGAVYVHCRLGEGRGPTMAAAYLISHGMRPQDAIAHLQRYRPFARPNKKQTRRLVEFAEYTNRKKR